MAQAFSLTGGMGGGVCCIRMHGSLCPASSFLLAQSLGTVAVFLGQQGIWPEHALLGTVNSSARQGPAFNLEKALGY